MKLLALLIAIIFGGCHDRWCIESYHPASQDVVCGRNARVLVQGDAVLCVCRPEVPDAAGR